MTRDPRERFLTLLREALAARTLKRLVLSRPVRPMLPPGFTDEGPVLQRLRIQPVRMRDGVKLAFAWQYDTRDQTDNLSVDEALVRIDALFGRHAHGASGNPRADGRAGIQQARTAAVSDEAGDGEPVLAGSWAGSG